MSTAPFPSSAPVPSTAKAKAAAAKPAAKATPAPAAAAAAAAEPAPAEAARVEAAEMAQPVAARRFEGAVRYGKENVDAVVEAGTILSRGLQDISQQVLGLAREQAEQTMAASKAVLSVRSLHDLIDLQSLLVRSSLDRLLSDGARLSDRSVKLVEEALRPIGARVNAAVDKLVKSAA